jgi:hypothetical protein
VDGLESAILRTVLYADIFNFPLTPQEIHHFLIYHQRIALSDVEYALVTSPALKQKLNLLQGYVVCAGRQELIPLRQEREKSSAHLWPRALQYGVWLARLPYVRMVALTGALAMHNAASENDDVDYLLVTAPGRVWLARAFSILLVRLARVNGIELCPNYVVAESALEQQRRDLFIAHEVTQMVPLYGVELYWRMRHSNAWVDDHLPNAEGMFRDCGERSIGRGWRWLKNGSEWLLNGRLGDLLENWEYHRKLRHFAPEMNKQHSAKLDEQQVKGHFNDHGHPILRKYYERLRQYGLEEARVMMPGD